VETRKEEKEDNKKFARITTVLTFIRPFCLYLYGASDRYCEVMVAQFRDALLCSFH